VVYGKDSTEHTNKICGENPEIVYTTDGGQYADHLKWLNRCSFKKNSKFFSCALNNALKRNNELKSSYNEPAVFLHTEI